MFNNFLNNNDDCSWIIWLIIILFLLGENGGCGNDCGGGCGCGGNGGNNFIFIIILIFLLMGNDC